MNNYLFEYDDPYKVLAHAIVGFYRPADVIRMLTDNAFILKAIANSLFKLLNVKIVTHCLILLSS